MANRVIRDRRQVDDRVEFTQVVGVRVPDVATTLLVAIGHDAEVAPFVPAGVEADDLMAEVQ